MQKRLKHETYIFFRPRCANQLSKNNKRPALLATVSTLCIFKKKHDILYSYAWTVSTKCNTTKYNTST